MKKNIKNLINTIKLIFVLEKKIKNNNFKILDKRNFLKKKFLDKKKEIENLADLQKNFLISISSKEIKQIFQKEDLFQNLKFKKFYCRITRTKILTLTYSGKKKPAIVAQNIISFAFILEDYFGLANHIISIRKVENPFLEMFKEQKEKIELEK